MKNVLTIKEFQGVCAIRDGQRYDPDNGCFPLGEKDFKSLEKLIFANVGRAENSLDIMSISYKKGVGKILQAKNFVGVISLPSGLQIEILPKIDIANDSDDRCLRQIFLKMLSSVFDLNYKTFKTSNLDKACRLPLFEVFIRDFCEKIRNVVRLGVKHDYGIEEDNLRTFKGKLIVSKQIRLNLAHKERFFVAYDEFGLNAVENRIIKTTLVCLANKTRNSRNKIDILQLLDLFDGVPMSNDVDSDIHTVSRKRIDEHYKSALQWSVLFLRGYSFSTFSGVDGTGATALLFPMEKLFEQYVARELWCAARGRGVNIKTQEKSRYLFESLVTYAGENAGPSFLLKPDIVLRAEGGGIVIADTKWKNLQHRERNLGCSQGDVYQMSAYYRKYSQEGEISEIMLVYPKTSDMPSEENVVGQFKDDDFVVTVVAYDLLNSCDSAKYILSRVQCKTDGDVYVA